MKKTMKKMLAIVLAIFMVVPTIPMVMAASEVANGTAGDGVTWVLDSNGQLTISGTGAIVVDWYAPPWEDYNESITSVVVEEGITKIPSSAFCYAKKLVTVTVPSTVTKIGPSAFWVCTSLEEINVHDDNVNYKSIDGILFSKDETTLMTYPMNKAGTEYNIPAYVTTIGQYAFAFNKSLKSVTIPDTVTSLESYAFYSANVDLVTLGKGITEIPVNCFSGSCIKTIVIPDSVKTLDDSVFHDTSHLETIVIGSGVESIGSYFISYCKNLSAIHYKGTQADWDEISIDENNEHLNEIEIHFISEDDYREGVTPTCVDGHTAGYYCEDCEIYVTGSVLKPVDEHTPDAEVEENYVAPNCTEDGSKDIVVYCAVCNAEVERETVTLDALGHADNDNDGYCEVCDEQICDHACHKSGISGFFWKLISFFCRLVGTQQYCECGNLHYDNPIFG